jgi:hypothetical protein
VIQPVGQMMPQYSRTTHELVLRLVKAFAAACATMKTTPAPTNHQIRSHDAPTSTVCP